MSLKHALMILVFITFFLSPSYADIYKYIDENRVVCYTDSLFSNKANLVMREKTETTQSRPKTVRWDSQDSTNYHSLVHEKTTKYKIDPLLIETVIKRESNWNGWAVSRKGAIGLKQIMPDTAREINVHNPFNPSGPTLSFDAPATTASSIVKPTAGILLTDMENGTTSAWDLPCGKRSADLILLASMPAKSRRLFVFSLSSAYKIPYRLSLYYYIYVIMQASIGEVTP